MGKLAQGTRLTQRRLQGLPKAKDKADRDEGEDAVAWGLGSRV